MYFTENKLNIINDPSSVVSMMIDHHASLVTFSTVRVYVTVSVDLLLVFLPLILFVVVCLVHSGACCVLHWRSMYYRGTCDWSLMWAFASREHRGFPHVLCFVSLRLEAFAELIDRDRHPKMAHWLLETTEPS